MRRPPEAPLDATGPKDAAGSAEGDRVSILLVDDRPDKLMALEAILGDLGQNLVRAYSGREALRALLQQDFAVILLDVNMPIMDGFETAEMIRSRPRSQQTPIIFFTAMSEAEAHVFRSYSLGAVDFIRTPVVPEKSAMASMSRARVKNRLRLVSTSRRSAASPSCRWCSRSWSRRICSPWRLTCSVFL